MNARPSNEGVLILAGPTACGKTALAIELAERLGAEIVGADSRQIYRDMPIGTAAPSEAQRARVPHHLVAFLDPRERYSAARFVADALTAIQGIHARGRRALVVGGTGFYVRALSGDVRLSAAFDPALRARLNAEARIHPPEVLHAWLAARDPRRARDVAPTDPYRVVRALEIALSESDERGEEHASLRSLGIPFLKAWLEIDQAVLDERIAARVDAMLAAGFVEEAERVGSQAVAADAIGYPQVEAYLLGLATQVELREHLVRATRRYAKRQRTWFRGESGVVAVPIQGAAATLARLARESLGWN